MVSIADRAESAATNFNAIRISIASPEQIYNWSHGEVTKPETINYRTLRPEKDGLFCERLFGPTKDWECFCGKYKRIRYRGVVCDRCGVEVTRAKVRRERMGRITLAAPVAHIWFSKTNPSRLGLLLDLSPRNLERVLYFAQHIVISVNEEARREAIEAAELAYELDSEKLQAAAAEKRADLEVELLRLTGGQQPETGNHARERHALPEGSEVLVDDGDEVTSGMMLASIPNSDSDSESALSQMTAEHDGWIEIDADSVTVVYIAESAPESGPVAELLATQQQIDAVNNQLAEDEFKLKAQLDQTLDELKNIKEMQLLPESRFRELTEKYSAQTTDYNYATGQLTYRGPEDALFVAGMGAESILAILRGVDLEKLRDQLINDMHSTSGQRRQKAIKRLRVVESFRQSGTRGQGGNEGTRVENMILTIMPVLPPELRPMVQLDGGRFATSDLNDLYRRVINRNNRLKRLMSLGAPEIIIRNEKRMLQEAVDALIDNGRRGRPIQGSHNHKLKSLSDLLRGKQGRFRQNLLGKRVDYSGRSVIVVGPELKMNQCGLPRRMALELFKPFVMQRLVMLGIAPNIKNAKRMVERARGEVWDILEDVIKTRPVLLNRAPTLHRLGIQAFMPVLIDGHAIQIHPLVCSAFNADFDGDQMAVHVPLSSMAVLEAQEAMMSTRNMLSPASGEPLVAPTLDMVMGCYYLTEVDRRPDVKGIERKFSDINEAREAYVDGDLDLRAPIYVRHIRGGEKQGAFYSTTMGRLLFNEILPDKFVYNTELPEESRIQNKQIGRDEIEDLTADLYRTLSNDETAEVLDAIKDLGFRHATSSGITIAINDIHVSPEKASVLAEAESKVDQYVEEYERGLISEEERHEKTIEAWDQASFQTAELIRQDIAEIDRYIYGGIGTMTLSGTKGNTSQINQMAGMRGLIRRPIKPNQPGSGVIELPVKSNFREGLSALEYFISSHGARKGLTDTALNTASSGYLTRRLIDIAQEVFVQGEDCGTLVGWAPRRPAPSIQMNLQDRVRGRLAAMTMANPETGEVLVERNEKITQEKADALIAAGVTEIMVRSPLTCEAPRGVCRMCYGDLAATGQLVQEGQAVGIIAAQSIGEPGTQLTMRTFHTGGVRRTRSTEDEVDLQKARYMQEFVNLVRTESEDLRTEFKDPIDRLGGAAPTLNSPRPSQAALYRFEQELAHFPEVLHLTTATINKIRANSERYLAGLHGFVNTFSDEDDFYRPTLERLEKRVSEGWSDALQRMTGVVEGLSAQIPDSAISRQEYALTKVSKVLVDDGMWVEQGTLLASSTQQELHPLPEGAEVLVYDGMWVEQGTLLASSIQQELHPLPEGAEVLVDDGMWIEQRTLLTSGTQQEQHLLPEGAEVLVDDGVWVEQGTPLASGTQQEQYLLPEGAEVRVVDEQEVQEGEILASLSISGDENATKQITASTSGIVGVQESSLSVASIGIIVTAKMAGIVEVQENSLSVTVPVATAQMAGIVGVQENSLSVTSTVPVATAQMAGTVEIQENSLSVTSMVPVATAKMAGIVEIAESGISIIQANSEAVSQLNREVISGTQKLSADLAELENIEADIAVTLPAIARQLREDVEFRNLDITGGLPKVEEIFEARIPKDPAIVTGIDGTVELDETGVNTILRVISREEFREEYPLPEGAQVIVDDGESVKPGMTLAYTHIRERHALPEGSEVLVDDGEEVTPEMPLASILNPSGNGESDTVQVTADNAGRVEVADDSVTVISVGPDIEATVTGRVEVSEEYISIIGEDEEVREYQIPPSVLPMVRENDQVNAGDALTDGPRNPHDILRIQGKEDLQKWMIDQVQAVYQSQGVTINDKHIEVILRQMMRRVQVREPGDTEFIPGEVVDKFTFQEQVDRVLAEGGEPAIADEVLLGVTRASLRTDSFLSAASFQETTRVLTEAAVRGQQDYLLGLKENVIIGRLIPAQVEIPGMAELLKPQPALDLSAVSPGAWRLHNSAETDEAETDLGVLGLEADDDGIERMARAMARSYASDDADEEDADDYFDDDDDEEEAPAEPVPPAVGLAEESDADEQPQD